jgi:hypothetical protein
MTAFVADGMASTLASTLARLALLNYVAERAVLLEPMSPEELLMRAFAPSHPRLVLTTDSLRQRAYRRLFLGAVTIADRNVEDPAEALQIVLCLSWLARLVDRAIC